MRSYRRIAMGIGILLLIASVVLFTPTLAMIFRGVVFNKRYRCQAGLASLWSKHAPLIMFYQPYRDRGQFPTNLLDIAGFLMQRDTGANWDTATGGRVLICPAREGSSQGRWRDVQTWCDFTYVYWPDGRDLTPKDFPLMYDRRLSNHGGKGINVVTVGGDVFWDRNAQWLVRFAHEHPDLDILLPEDL